MQSISKFPILTLSTNEQIFIILFVLHFVSVACREHEKMDGYLD